MLLFDLICLLCARRSSTSTNFLVSVFDLLAELQLVSLRNNLGIILGLK